MDPLPPQNEPNVPKNRRKYTYHAPLTIPKIPQPPPLADSPEYRLTPSSSSPTTLQTPQISPTVLQLIRDHAGTGVTLSQSASPTTPDSNNSLLEPFAHQQVKKVLLSKFDHVDRVLESCQENFETLADFLDALFENVHRNTLIPEPSDIDKWFVLFFRAKTPSDQLISSKKSTTTVIVIQAIDPSPSTNALLLLMAIYHSRQLPMHDQQSHHGLYA